MAKVISINRTPGDFIRATRHLTLEERGAYQDILDQIVVLGQDEDPPSLPDDDKSIAGILGVSVQKWRRIKARLCSGPLAVLITERGRISQTRIVREIEEARTRIDRAEKAGKASGASRSQKRGELRARLAAAPSNTGSTQAERKLNLSSTGVATLVELEGQLDANLERTSHESRVTSNKKDVVPIVTTSFGDAADEGRPVIKNPELPEDGLGALDIVQQTWETILPDASPLDDITVSKWLQQNHPHPWCIAAAICEASELLRVEAGNPAAYLGGIVRGRKEWPCDVAEAYVRHFTSASRLSVIGGVA